MSARTIVVLGGDQTGQELLEEALRVLQPDITRVPTEFSVYDLSLENRRATKNAVVREAAAAMAQTGLGLKAATITPETKGDVGSPNAILREAINGKVILRIGRRIPGIRPVGGVHAPMAVVRMAVDDAYGAKEWREAKDGDEIAYRTAHISRSTCRAVAEFTFRRPSATAPRSLAARSTPSAPSTKACSRKSSTPLLSATRPCATSRSSSTPPWRCC